MARDYAELPANPPEYDDFVVSDDENTSGRAPGNTDDEEARVFEEFEIDDGSTGAGAGMGRRGSVFSRAKTSGVRWASSLQAHVLQPVSRVMDPVYEAYRNSNIIFDSYLARVGNPLILKRLIYVFSITAVIYIITASGIYPNRNEALFGDFYDPEKLNAFIESHINPESMATTLKYLSSMPHIAGTAGDLTLARYIEETLHNNGLSAVDFYEVDSYINYPNVTSLEVTDAAGVLQHTARMSDGASGAGDAAGDAAGTQMEFVAFNPDSAAGQAAGQLVYANYGTPEDFTFLVDNAINLEGKIVLVKYGKLPASQKVEIAEMYSAVGVLFMSDPEDSAYSMDSIQKEGVGIYKEAPGDVLSPGWASVSDLNRVGWRESASTPKIVSVPISWREAQPLFASLRGQGVRSDGWAVSIGGKSVEVWTGHSADVVRVVNRPVQRTAKPVWNVIGRITGREQYDKAIVIGAQRDAPCYGAVHPNTGTTVLLELVRLFAKMQSTYNWAPLRSIYFVSFDATEYNLAGATEWVESKMRELKKEVYAYIDLSDAVSGDQLDIHAHPILKQVIMSSLGEVKAPRSNDTLLEAQFQARHMSIETLKDYSKNYSPFQSYLAIPSMELKFSGKKYPARSCLDTYENFEATRVDDDMLVHRTLVELLAKISVKLVEEPLIPFDVLNYASSMDHYLKDVKEYAESLPGYRGNELDSTAFISSLLKLKAIGTEYEGWINAWRDIVNSDNDQEPSLLTVNRWNWNLKLTLFEKRLLSTTGIPNRSWYRNVIFGPQYWQPENDEKYEWTTLPGVRDALRGKDWKLAREQLNFAADLLAQAADSFIG